MLNVFDSGGIATVVVEFLMGQGCTILHDLNFVHVIKILLCSLH